MAASENKMIRIGVSSCLLGNKVRYHGGHRHDRYITETLMNHYVRISGSSITSTLTQRS